jgi:hypothetical protein
MALTTPKSRPVVEVFRTSTAVPSVLLSRKMSPFRSAANNAALAPGGGLSRPSLSTSRSIALSLPQPVSSPAASASSPRVPSILPVRIALMPPRWIGGGIVVFPGCVFPGCVFPGFVFHTVGAISKEWRSGNHDEME